MRTSPPTFFESDSAFNKSYRVLTLNFTDAKKLPELFDLSEQPPFWIPELEYRSEGAIPHLRWAEVMDPDSFQYSDRSDSYFSSRHWVNSQLVVAERMFRERFTNERVFDRAGVKMYASLEVFTEESVYHVNSGEAKTFLRMQDVSDFILKKMAVGISSHDENYHSDPTLAIKSLKIFINTYSPVRGGTFVELPDWIRVKNNKDMCVLNVKNRDEKCFMWAILSVLHPAQRNRERVSHYKQYAEELDFTGISFPVSIDDIPRFEKQNPHIAISAYETSEEDVRPWRVSKFAGSDEKTHIPLLLHKGHWSAITNWNRLCSTGHTVSCPRCLCRFGEQYDISKHLETCRGFDCQAAKMPEKGSKVKFNPYKGAVRLPVCVYSDFEALQPACESRSNSTSTIQKAEHQACSFKIFVAAPKELDIGPRTYLYTGKDAATVWADQILEVEKTIKDAIQMCNKPPIKRPEDIAAFEAATECYLCGKSFEESPIDKTEAVAKRVFPNRALTLWMRDHAFWWTGRPATLSIAMAHILVAPKLNSLEDIAKSRKKSDPGFIVHGVGPAMCRFLQKCPDSVWAGEYEEKKRFKSRNDKVWEHCHITGAYRGAAHQYCNCQCRKDSLNIPVCFHNAKGYDSHFIVDALAKIQERTEEEVEGTQCFTSNAPAHQVAPVLLQTTLDGKIADFPSSSPSTPKRKVGKQLTLDGQEPPKIKRARTVRYKSEQTLLKPFPVVPVLDEPIIEKQHARKMRLSALSESHQKFKTFSINSLTILDTCAHLPSSLDKLLKDLPVEKKKNLRSLCSTLEQFELVQQKLLIPYEKMTSFDWFSQPISTNKDDYYSSLNEKAATDKDMETLQKVMKAFNLRTNREIHDLYLRVDVMALADVFESYRDLAIADYGLDPAAFIGTPSFGWAAMLKKTGVKLDLLSDVDMYTFFEKAKRGGVAMAATRHAKANNPLVEGYDPEQQESYIWYGDANNLYGDAMCQKLPQSNFRWGDPDTFDPHADWSGSEGAYAEVDLEYPAHLHDLHSNLPLAPENISITSDMLSDVQKKMCDDKLPAGNRKLTPHFNEHKNYIVHAANLKYYLEMGLVLKKVHRVVYYEQSAWLKPWIEFNTARRAKAKSDFEKNYYKLMNNAVFGKTMQDVRGRTNVHFITTKWHYEKQTGRPSYKYTMDFGSENFRITFEKATEVELDQPIYAGASVLDLSKLVMYRFHYGVMQPKFGAENLDLLMTDTDSLMYCVRTKDFYKQLQDISEHLDTSDYPKDHPLYSTVNKKVVGKFKDETNGVPISEACCLRAKLYWFNEAKDHRKCKGVKKSAASKLTGEDYVNALHGQDKHVSFQTLRSYDHRIYTETIQKKALSGFDDKRYMSSDLIHTRPHGHFRNV